MSLATIEIGRRSITTEMARKYGMETTPFEQTLRATVFPSGGSKEQFAAFLLVAHEYGLNPVTREIYAFPGKGGIVPIVGIDGWLKLVNSHPAFDGMQFEENSTDGELVSITCSIWRKDRSKPIVVTEHLSECIRLTEPWKMKHRMLRHKAMIQCARYAFGFAGIFDPDEGERIVLTQDGRDTREAVHISHAVPVPPVPPSPPPSAVRKQLEASVAQIEAEKAKGDDFWESYRDELRHSVDNDEANGIFDRYTIGLNETDREECQAILNEETARFWKDEGE